MHITHTHTRAHTHSHTYKNKYMYTLTQALVHTPPKRHTTGYYHYPCNRLARTLATNQGDWSAPCGQKHVQANTPMVLSGGGICPSDPEIWAPGKPRGPARPLLPTHNSQALCLKVTEKPPGQGWSQAWHMGL